MDSSITLCHNQNEMSTLHTVKTYHLPTLLYGCEAWSLSNTDLHKLDVAWNNCFRRIFQCCWRESICCHFGVINDDDDMLPDQAKVLDLFTVTNHKPL